MILNLVDLQEGGHPLDPSILVADDTAEIRRLVKRFLEIDGQSWDMTFATSGTEAVDAFRSGGPFDFVLLDFMMPGMNGVEAAQDIRAAGYLGPLVIWSSAGIMIPLDRAEAIDAEVLDKSEIRTLMARIKQAATGLRTGSAALAVGDEASPTEPGAS